jgi:signal transduction histidine kinase
MQTKGCLVQGFVSILSLTSQFRAKGLVIVWLLFAILSVTLFLKSIPTYFDNLLTPLETSRDNLTLLGFWLKLRPYYFIGWQLVAYSMLFALASFLFIKRRTNGIVFLASTLMLTFGATITTSWDGLLITQEWAQSWIVGLWGLGFATSFSFYFVFPSGKFVPSWSRVPVVCWIVWTLSWPLLHESPSTPINWPPYLQLTFFPVVYSLGIAAQIWRYVSMTDSGQRQQAKMVVMGVFIAYAGYCSAIAVPFLLPIVQDSEVLYATYEVLAVPIILITTISPALAIGASILRYRLWDIDAVLNRTLVYGVLTGFTVLLYMVIVGGLGALLQASGSFWISLLAAGVVAALFQPLRAWLQRRVNHMLYGERDEPYKVLSGLGQDLQAARDAHAVVHTIAGTVARALKVPYAALRMARGEHMETVASAGTPVGETITLAVRYRAEVLGELIIAPRAPGDSFNSTERRLLEDIAQQAGVAANTLRLQGELQRALERTVMAREDERRTLRRDLHDHFAPALSGLMLKMEAIRNLIGGDDATARRLVGELRDQTQTAVGEIRTLAYNLRPPALDDLGLAAAITEFARQSGTAPATQMLVRVPEPLPALTAAVEAAAYRIATEAITNIFRHARAQEGWVYIAIQAAGTLSLIVEDNGLGFPDSYRAGVGITVMRERATELGGTLTITPRPGGGTIVTALIPMR